MITIQSKSHTYEVRSSDSLDTALNSAITPDKSLVLVDSNILRIYSSSFKTLQERINPNKIIPILANEDNKSYRALESLICQIVETGTRRDHKIIVIGGGVVQDIGCFIASTLYRGLWWEFIPTTLLAQCDSCIGGKSSLNIGKHKNQLGTFYAPQVIYLVPGFLSTLSPAEIHSGIGEMIKLHWIGGEADFLNLKNLLNQYSSEQYSVGQTSSGQHPSGNLNALQAGIKNSLQIKKKFIEEDEFDHGIRNLLNFGHTFGHAFEAATQFAIPHGVAVSLGMLAAIKLSERIGWLPQSSVGEFQEFIQPFVHPFEKKLQNADLEKILISMKRDKKNRGDDVTCILTRGFGQLEKVPISVDQTLRPFLKEFLMLDN